MKTAPNTPSVTDSDNSKKEIRILTVDQLYDRYSSVLYGVALKITGNENVAEEVLTEAFIEINRDLVNVQLESENICICLVAIVRRIANQKISAFKTNHHPSDFVNTNELADAFNLARRDHIIARPESILELILYGGLSLNQAAGVLRISVSEASQHLRREVNQYRKLNMK